MDKIKLLEVEPELKIPKYASKQGFVDTDILRGGYEVERLYHEMYKLGGVICGGYVRWMCSPADVPVPAGDVDVYFPEERDFERAKLVLQSRYGLVKKHENAVSYTFAKPHNGSRLRGCPDIQLIKPVEEGRIMTVNKGIEEVLVNFDFTVVRAGLVSPRVARVDADYNHDEQRKILRLKNIHCPVGSTLRCMKYSKKGYWLPPTQALKLFFDWDNRTPEYRDKLIDFLMKANDGMGLTQQEIDEMEAMFQVD